MAPPVSTAYVYTVSLGISDNTWCVIKSSNLNAEISHMNGDSNIYFLTMYNRICHNPFHCACMKIQ